MTISNLAGSEAITALEARIKQEAHDKTQAAQGFNLVAAHWLDDAPLAEVLAHGGPVDHARGTMQPHPAMGGTAMRDYLARTSGRWLEWSGKVWAEVDDERAITLAKNEMKKIFMWLACQPEVTDKDTKIFARLLRASTSRNVLHFLKGELLAGPETFDAHPDLLNCQNGVVDLRTGQLEPHDAALRMTKITSVKYDKYDEHEDWDQALSALPEEVTEWLQVRYGQAITGYRTDDDRIIFQDGHGSNGKSTLVDGVRTALGGYSTNVSHKVLLASQGEHTTESYSLKGVRFAVLEELPEGGRVNDKQLKDLAGTDTMRARRMRMDDEEFRVTHSLIVNTNHMPIVGNADDSTWRRIVRIRFPYKYVLAGEECAPHHRAGDSTIRERIISNEEEQLEAVLAWLVAGAYDWYDMGKTLKAFPWPEQVKADTEAWKAEADPIFNYLQEKIVFDPNGQILATDLYKDFKEFLEAAGKTVWSAETFGSRFSAHEAVMSHDVSRVRTTAPQNLSRRYSSALMPPVSGKVRVWRGVRFN